MTSLVFDIQYQTSKKEEQIHNFNFIFYKYLCRQEMILWQEMKS